MALSDCIAYSIGVFILIGGILIGFTWPVVFEYILREKLELSSSSETYKLWVKTPIPMYLEIYLFNWTNSEEFLSDNKIKPEFREVGPFVFKEVHQRVDVIWNVNNTVSYNQTRTWSFVPQDSIDLSTSITNLNVIVTTITRMASRYSIIIKYILDFLNDVFKEKLLITRPAREWLFDGINDDFMKKLLDIFKNVVDIPYDKFGWFYGRNLSSSFDGRFNINTGKDNIYNLGAIQQWNYINKTRFYEGDCGLVKGSSGELFSPIKGQKDSISIFVTDFCGSLTLKRAGSKSVEGLTGYRYIGDQDVFDNGTLNPSAKCFCSGECSPSGVRNVTSCRQAPLFISFPHFYLADSSYIDSVGGIKPNKSEHEFYINIEPITGLPLEVSAQLQINVLLQPLKEFPMFKNVPKIYIPMMWFRQRAKVTPDLASRGKTLLMFEKIGLWVACCLGLLGFIIIIIRFCFVKYFFKIKNFELLIAPETGEDESQACDHENER